jgi:hypothetical protein
MTRKMALTVSVIMLIATSGASTAGPRRVPPHRSEVLASGQAEHSFNSLDSATSTLAALPNPYRYHGGPKSND